MFAIIIQHIKFILLLVVSFGMSKFITNRQRRGLFPYVTAILLGTIILSIFLPDSRLLGYLLMAGTYTCIAFLINMGDIKGVKMNSLFIWFLVFYFYYDLVNFYSDYALIGFYSKNQGFIMYFLPGIMAGIYCAKNNIVFLLNRWIAVSAIIICVVYQETALQTISIEIGDRASMEGLNSNLLGLFMTTLLVFSLMSVVDIREKLLFKGLAVVSSLFCTYILIMTGSRNAFLGGLTGLIGVLLMSKRNRIVNICLLSMAFVVGGIYFFRSYVTEDVRVLNKYNYVDDSGRSQWWRDSLAQKTTLKQNLIGRGSYYDESRIYEGTILHSNMHSVYFQIYYEMGYIGCVLLFIYLIRHVSEALKNKDFGPYSLVYLAVAMASGVGESYPLRGGTLSIVWGLSIGLLLVRRGNQMSASLFLMKPA
jgi:O-antigen ligase